MLRRRHAAIAATEWNSIRSSSVTPRINLAIHRARIERLGLGRCCEAELWFKRSIAVPGSALPLAAGPATRFPTFGAIEECVRGPGTPRPHPFKLQIEIAQPNHQLARANVVFPAGRPVPVLTAACNFLPTLVLRGLARETPQAVLRGRGEGARQPRWQALTEGACFSKLSDEQIDG
jgi:hypothetical protein